MPSDQELLADLCAPRFTVQANGIKVESKEDVTRRLGRSPDCGDAVVLACRRVPHMPPRDTWATWEVGGTGREADAHRRLSPAMRRMTGLDR